MISQREAWIICGQSKEFPTEIIRLENLGLQRAPRARREIGVRFFIWRRQWVLSWWFKSLPMSWNQIFVNPDPFFTQRKNPRPFCWLPLLKFMARARRWNSAKTTTCLSGRRTNHAGAMRVRNFRTNFLRWRVRVKKICRSLSLGCLTQSARGRRTLWDGAASLQPVRQRKTSRVKVFGDGKNETRCFAS